MLNLKRVQLILLGATILSSSVFACNSCGARYNNCQSYHYTVSPETRMIIKEQAQVNVIDYQPIHYNSQVNYNYRPQYIQPRYNYVRPQAQYYNIPVNNYSNRSFTNYGIIDKDNF